MKLLVALSTLLAVSPAEDAKLVAAPLPYYAGYPYAGYGYAGLPYAAPHICRSPYLLLPLLSPPQLPPSPMPPPLLPMWAASTTPRMSLET